MEAAFHLHDRWVEWVHIIPICYELLPSICYDLSLSSALIVVVRCDELVYRFTDETTRHFVLSLGKVPSDHLLQWHLSLNCSVVGNDVSLTGLACLFTHCSCRPRKDPQHPIRYHSQTYNRPSSSPKGLVGCVVPFGCWHSSSYFLLNLKFFVAEEYLRFPPLFDTTSVLKASNLHMRIAKDFEGIHHEVSIFFDFIWFIFCYFGGDHV